MAFWQRFLGLVSGSGYRQEGTQLGAPSYSDSAATTVTLDSAFQLSAVWACVKLITETVSSLPLNVYRIKDGVRELDTTHRLSTLFKNGVNRWQTLQEFLETMVYQYASQGNAYAVIERNGNNQVVSLIPLMSQQMSVDLLRDGTVTYQYTDGRDVKVYSQKSIMHWKMFGNGIIGLSPLAHARNSIGIGQATEKAVTKIYKNGGKPSGMLILDKVLTPDQRTIIKENFAELATGNEDRLYVLEAGMKYQQLSLSPQDIELLKSRRFQIEDICRFFGVPSVLVNDTTAGTTWGSGIQQIVEGFYKLGLKPYITRIEGSIIRNLFTVDERQVYDVEFDFNSLIQPDLSERMKTYKEAVTGGIMTPNQVRLLEGWTPADGGEELYMQQQMTPISVLKDLPRGTTPQQNPDTQNFVNNKKPEQIFNITMPEINFTSPDINISSPDINLPANNINVDIPKPEVTVNMQQSDQPIVVNMPEINPVFNFTVDSPDVHLEANLPPPEVQVILPKRKSETKVDYNGKGDIVRTTTTEEDA